MNRNDVTIIGLGGCGGRLTDAIANVDPRYQIFFINSSLTDIQSLDNYDDVDKNYFCISSQNGAGRDKNLGRRYAQKNGYNLLDIIQRFDSRTLFFVTSFGGGSGSSSLEVLMGAIKKLKDDGEFDDKTINLIGILPSLDSSDTILKNALSTWNNIIGNDCINNMMFVDNNNLSRKDFQSEEEMEKAINEQFATLFDSMFDVPNSYNTKFDTMNLSRIINSKGCTYLYNLPNDCSSLDEALKQADNSSVLAKMYKTKENTVIVKDGDRTIEKIRCGFIGTSFSNENFTNSDILNRFTYTEENFEGINEDEDSNLLILSGCLPPLLSVQVIQAELQDRDRKKAEATNIDLSKFTLDYNNESAVANTKTETPTPQQKPKDRNKSMKKTMKKNLFDMY